MTNNSLKNFQEEISILKNKYDINSSSIPYFDKATALEVINQRDFNNYNMEFQIYFEDNYYNYIYIEAGRNPNPRILCRTKDIDELKYCALKNILNYTADLEARKKCMNKHVIMFNLFNEINKVYALKYANEYSL